VNGVSAKELCNQPDVSNPSAFTGWVRPISVCGLDAAELKIECGTPPTEFGRDAYKSERTRRERITLRQVARVVLKSWTGE
jgi:hypothetical protein